MNTRIKTDKEAANDSTIQERAEKLKVIEPKKDSFALNEKITAIAEKLQYLEEVTKHNEIVNKKWGVNS